MQRYAQICDGKVYWIFESEETPIFASDIKIINISGNNEVKEGWNYNADTEQFAPPVIVPIVPVVVQPTNQDVMDNLMIVMMALNDIYMMLPEPPA